MASRPHLSGDSDLSNAKVWSQRHMDPELQPGAQFKLLRLAFTFSSNG